MFPHHSLLILLPCLLLLLFTTTTTSSSFSLSPVAVLNSSRPVFPVVITPRPSSSSSSFNSSSGLSNNTTPPPPPPPPPSSSFNSSSGFSNNTNTGGFCNKTSGFCNNTVPLPNSPPSFSPSNVLAPLQYPGPDVKNEPFGHTLIIIIMSLAFVTVLMLIALCHYFKRRKGNAIASGSASSIADNFVSDYKIRLFKVYKFDELRTATNCFSDDNKLGQGGFGPVYKGVLHGEEIAVKKLSTEKLEREHGVRAIRSEVESLAMAKHRNLVQLFGFSSDGDEQLLVYEYLENRSLDMFLFDPSNHRLLPWQTRYNIIDGVARGLAYIHLGLSTVIVHRDLKASNVLLDRNMNPKISDFGLARLLGDDQSRAYTHHKAGTRGYMAPEFLLYNEYSAKSDIFSFGILVLEIVSGKKNNGYYFICEKNLPDLLSYAKKVGNEGALLQLIDEDLNQAYHKQQAMKCIKIGLLCTEENPADRPTMKDILCMLDNEK